MTTSITSQHAGGDSYAAPIIGQILGLWENENKLLTRFYEKYPDAVIRQPIASGRNSPYYLLGHLAATSDALVPVLRLGEKVYPELEQFLHLPERDVLKVLSLADLLRCWTDANARVIREAGQLTVSQWLERHGLVTEADFQKEPKRNRLNVFISRLGHQRYHLGQLALFTPGSV